MSTVILLFFGILTVGAVGVIAVAQYQRRQYEIKRQAYEELETPGLNQPPSPVSIFTPVSLATLGLVAIGGMFLATAWVQESAIEGLKEDFTQHIANNPNSTSTTTTVLASVDNSTIQAHTAVTLTQAKAYTDTEVGALETALITQIATAETDANSYCDASISSLSANFSAANAYCDAAVAEVDISGANAYTDAAVAALSTNFTAATMNANDYTDAAVAALSTNFTAATDSANDYCDASISSLAANFTAANDYCDVAVSDLNAAVTAELNRIEALATAALVATASDGFHCWDLNHDNNCTLPTEDINHDGNCTVLDCQGAAGNSSFQCWDLDQDNTCDVSTEDKNLDGLCTTADCHGLPGANGTDGTPGAHGYHCWDLNENRLCDLRTEDLNSDGNCTVADCTHYANGSIELNKVEGAYIDLKYQLDSDADVRLKLEGTGDLALYTGGDGSLKKAMTINWQQHVGIGLANPSYPLHVFQNTTSYNQMRVYSVGKDGRAGVSLYHGLASNDMVLQHAPTGEGFLHNRGGNLTIMAESLHLFSNDQPVTEALHIPTSGKIGLRTRNTGIYDIHAAGSMYLEGEFETSGNVKLSTGNIEMIPRVSATIGAAQSSRYKLFFDASNNDKLSKINSTGGVTTIEGTGGTGGGDGVCTETCGHAMSLYAGSCTSNAPSNCTTTMARPSTLIPTFENSWINFGGSYSTAFYSRDDAGVVTIEGVVKSGTVNSVIFTLPLGYRPPAQLMFVANIADIGTYCTVEVHANGQVKAVTACGNTRVSLSNIIFPTVHNATASPLNLNTTCTTNCWNTVGTTWGPTTSLTSQLINSWVVVGGAYATPAAVVNDAGMVVLQGAVKSGVDNVIMVLPVGLRPDVQVTVHVYDAAADECRVVVNTNGEVFVVLSQPGCDVSHISLDGITFAVDTGTISTTSYTINPCATCETASWSANVPQMTVADAVTPLNGWSFGAGKVGVSKDVNGYVNLILETTAIGTYGVASMQLAAGYRPAATLLFSTWGRFSATDPRPGTIEVRSNGDVVFLTGSGGVLYTLSIRFRAADASVYAFATVACTGASLLCDDTYTPVDSIVMSTGTTPNTTLPVNNGTWELFFDSTNDGKLSKIDSSGTVTTIEGAGGGGGGSSLPASPANNSFLVANAAGEWVESSLAATKTVLGLQSGSEYFHALYKCAGTGDPTASSCGASSETGNYHVSWDAYGTNTFTSQFTYAHSTVTGDTWTINTPGMYHFSAYIACYGPLALVKNIGSTTRYYDSTIDQKLAFSLGNPSVDLHAGLSASVYLQAGDVVRMQLPSNAVLGASNCDTMERWFMRIAMQSAIGQQASSLYYHALYKCAGTGDPTASSCGASSETGNYHVSWDAYGTNTFTSQFTYAHSTVTGDTWTINTPGVYHFSVHMQCYGPLALVKNIGSTTLYYDSTIDQRLAFSLGNPSLHAHVGLSASVYLQAGDVVRLQTPSYAVLGTAECDFMERWFMRISMQE